MVQRWRAPPPGADLEHPCTSKELLSVPIPYLHNRIQGWLGGFHFAILHQPGGHETEASEELMGPCTRGNTRGICSRS